MTCSQMVGSTRSAVHSRYDLFMTGPHMAISITESIKKGPEEKK